MVTAMSHLDRLTLYRHRRSMTAPELCDRLDLHAPPCGCQVASLFASMGHSGAHRRSHPSITAGT